MFLGSVKVIVLEHGSSSTVCRDLKCSKYNPANFQTVEKLREHGFKACGIAISKFHSLQLDPDLRLLSVWSFANPLCTCKFFFFYGSGFLPYPKMH